MRSRGIGLVVAVVLAALLAAPNAPSPARAAPEQVYIALGDSIAAGLATSRPETRGYPWLVDDLLERLDGGDNRRAVNLVNLAVPGETARSFIDGGQLARFRDEVGALRARGAQLVAVTVTLGGNDLLNVASAGDAERQAALDAFGSAYPAALDGIRAALGDWRPALIVTTAYDPSEGDPAQDGSDTWWVARFNDAIRSAAPAHDARVVDLEQAFRGHIADWTWYPSDVHPNNVGHEQIARLVWQAMGFDTDAPTIEIERPSSGPLSRRTPTVRAVVWDDTRVTDVDLWADGEQVGTMRALPDGDGYAAVWDGRSHAPGDVVIEVRARDAAGNEGVARVTVAVPEG